MAVSTAYIERDPVLVLRQPNKKNFSKETSFKQRGNLRDASIARAASPKKDKYIYGCNKKALLAYTKRHPLRTALNAVLIGAGASAVSHISHWSHKNLRSVDGFDEIASALGIATAELAVFAGGTPLVFPGAQGAVEEYAETVAETHDLIRTVKQYNQLLDQAYEHIYKYVHAYDRDNDLGYLRTLVLSTPPEKRNTNDYRQNKERYVCALKSMVQCIENNTKNVDGLSDVERECQNLLTNAQTQEVYLDNAVKDLNENIHQVRTHWTGAVAMAGMGASMVVGITKTAWEVVDKVSLPAQLVTSLSGMFMGSQILMALYGMVRIKDGQNIHTELKQQATAMQKYTNYLSLKELTGNIKDKRVQRTFKLVAQDNQRRIQYNRYGGTMYGAVTAVGQTCMATGTGLTLGTAGLGIALSAPLFAVGVPLTLIGAAMRSTVEACFKRYTGNKEQEANYAKHELPERNLPDAPKAPRGLSLRTIFGFKQKPATWISEETVPPSKATILHKKSHADLRTEAVATISDAAQQIAENKLLSHVRHVIKRSDWSSMSMQDRCEAVLKRTLRSSRTTLLKQSRSDVTQLASKLLSGDVQGPFLTQLRNVIQTENQTLAYEALLGMMVEPEDNKTTHRQAFETFAQKSAEGNQDYQTKFFKSLEKEGQRSFFHRGDGPLGVISRFLLPNRFLAVDLNKLKKPTDKPDQVNRTYTYLQEQVSKHQSAHPEIHVKVSKACLKSLLRAGKREGKQLLQEGFSTMILAQRLQEKRL